MSPKQDKKLVCALWMGTQPTQGPLSCKHWNSRFEGQQAGLTT